MIANLENLKEQRQLLLNKLAIEREKYATMQIDTPIFWKRENTIKTDMKIIDREIESLGYSKI